MQAPFHEKKGEILFYDDAYTDSTQSVIDKYKKNNIIIFITHRFEHNIDNKRCLFIISLGN